MSDLYVGCCGAYCKTCMASGDGTCRGCRLGYEEGERKIGRARCKIKRCCLIEKGLPTCMECDDFEACRLLDEFYSKFNSRQRIRRAAEFIREYGYDRFIEIADDWTGSKGDLPKT